MRQTRQRAHALVAFLLFSLAVLFAVRPCSGQSVQMPETVEAKTGRLGAVRIKWEGSEVKWTAPKSLDVFREYDPDSNVIRLRFIGYEPGKHDLIAVACKDGKMSDFVRCCVCIKGPAPPPDPAPVPPGPTPTPDPPEPDPDEKAPIPLPGLRVLILYESEDIPRYPSAQVAILYDRELRKYLDENCVKGARNHEWRIWDVDVDVSGEEKHWRDVMERRPLEKPWIVISNGRTGYEGPLPGSVSATMDLIRKYEVK